MTKGEKWMSSNLKGPYQEAHYGTFRPYAAQYVELIRPFMPDSNLDAIALRSSVWTWQQPNSILGCAAGLAPRRQRAIPLRSTPPYTRVTPITTRKEGCLCRPIRLESWFYS